MLPILISVPHGGRETPPEIAAKVIASREDIFDDGDAWTPHIYALKERVARFGEYLEIVDRLLFALVNEGMNILDEGIAQRPGDIDVVYVYGYGFPAWRGGPMHHADAIGLAQVHERVREFERRFGSGNWTPAPLLRRLAGEGKTLADWANSQVN